MTVSLRRARRNEAQGLAQLHEESAVAGFANVFRRQRYPFPREAALKGWRELLACDEVVVFVAEDGARLVGLSVVRPEWLERLFVHPSAWGRGVGSRLHDESLRHVRGLGSSRCNLWVLEENDRARAFYERRGWRLNGQTRVVPFAPHPVDVGYTFDF